MPFDLKSLIVRPAVSRVLALLNQGLKHRDWAGLTGYTSPFGFATGYVFVKQSGSPCHCDLQMPYNFKDIHRHPLYLRYGANMPNSLSQLILSRLSLLSQSTSVGSGYGY